MVPLASKLDDRSGRAYLRIQAQGLSNESMRPATRTVVQRIGRSLGALDANEHDSCCFTRSPTEPSKKNRETYNAATETSSSPRSAGRSKASSSPQAESALPWVQALRRDGRL